MVPKIENQRIIVRRNTSQGLTAQCPASFKKGNKIQLDIFIPNHKLITILFLPMRSTCFYLKFTMINLKKIIIKNVKILTSLSW